LEGAEIDGLQKQNVNLLPVLFQGPLVIGFNSKELSLSYDLYLPFIRRAYDLPFNSAQITSIWHTKHKKNPKFPGRLFHSSGTHQLLSVQYEINIFISLPTSKLLPIHKFTISLHLAYKENVSLCKF
jgi:hypothetical protein